MLQPCRRKPDCEISSDGFSHLTFTDTQPTLLSTAKINTAHSPDAVCSAGLRAVYSFWPTAALLAMASSPFMSIFTPLPPWVYASTGSDSSQAQESLSAYEEDEFAGRQWREWFSLFFFAPAPFAAKLTTLRLWPREHFKLPSGRVRVGGYWEPQGPPTISWNEIA